MGTSEADTNERDSGDGGYVTGDHLLTDVLGDHPKTKILAAFVGNPDIDYNVTEIAEASNLKRDTVYKYLDTLRGWGLIKKTRRVGNSQMYALNKESEAAESLAQFEWRLMKHLGAKEQAGELDQENKPKP